MTGIKKSLTRRAFAQALAVLFAIPFVRRFGPTPSEDIVEVNGWIVKRSDLA
ncbi:MAG: hypothetical protein WBA44_13900 [Mesorhizobium sp.]